MGTVLVLRRGPTPRGLEGSSPDMGEVWGHPLGTQQRPAARLYLVCADDVGEGTSSRNSITTQSSSPTR